MELCHKYIPRMSLLFTSHVLLKFKRKLTLREMTNCQSISRGQGFNPFFKSSIRY